MDFSESEQEVILELEKFDESKWYCNPWIYPNSKGGVALLTVGYTIGFYFFSLFVIGIEIPMMFMFCFVFIVFQFAYCFRKFSSIYKKLNS